MVSSSSPCPYWVLSPIRTILEPLLIPVLLLAYLPQYIKMYRHGTTGVSNRFVLCLCYFSTLQFATRLVNWLSAGAVQCILYRGEPRGIRAFSALIGYFQLFAQWLSAMIWLYFFLRYRKPERDPEYTPLLASEDEVRGDEQSNEPASKQSSIALGEAPDHMAFLAFAHAVFFIGVSLGLLVSPRPSAQQSFAGPFLRALATDVFNLACILLGLGHVIALCVVQVRDAQANPRAKGVSIFSLVLQIIALLALAILQLFRPFPPLLPGWRTEIWGLFFDRWSVSANYFIMVGGHVITLFIRYFHSPP